MNNSASWAFHVIRSAPLPKESFAPARLSGALGEAPPVVTGSVRRIAPLACRLALPVTANLPPAMSPQSVPYPSAPLPNQSQGGWEIVVNGLLTNR